ncbi:MAG: glycosyltransferase family 4 protein [Patescibacteria group bacterium]
MRVLIATPLYPPDIGGPATYAKILEDELPKRAVSVEIISYGSVRHLPKIFGYPFFMFKIFWRARNVDLLLALDPVHTGLSSWFAAVIWRKKFIVRIAGDYAWEQGKQRFGVADSLDLFVKKPSREFSIPVRILRHAQTFVANHARRVIVPSRYFMSIVLSWGIPEEKIIVVYNAFEEPPRIPPRLELRKNFGFSGSVILSAGRLVTWKGFATLIALMPEIRKRHPDCRLYIAGSGPLAHALKKQINEQGLGGVVTMLGDVPHLKLMEYKRAADCFVLNTGYEGFSHHILEALAMGIPVVTTNIGGNPELIEHGVTGMLVVHDDSVALQKTIESVLENPEYAQRISLQGKKFAASFTVNRMVLKTIQALTGANTL